jgi:putative two-component system response regulator
MQDSIPLPARIVAVARSYALAMADAPTKEGHAAALDLIRAGRGTRFDPDIVDVLLANEAALAALMGDWNDRTDG